MTTGGPFSNCLNWANGASTFHFSKSLTFAFDKDFSLSLWFKLNNISGRTNQNSTNAILFDIEGNITVTQIYNGSSPLFTNNGFQCYKFSLVMKDISTATNNTPPIHYFFIKKTMVENNWNYISIERINTTLFLIVNNNRMKFKYTPYFGATSTSPAQYIDGYWQPWGSITANVKLSNPNNHTFMKVDEFVFANFSRSFKNDYQYTTYTDWSDFNNANSISDRSDIPSLVESFAVKKRTYPILGYLGNGSHSVRCKSQKSTWR
jgi:hypothetical protein